MRDRAHELAGRASARNSDRQEMSRQQAGDQRQQTGDQRRQAADEPITPAEEQRLSAAAQAAYQRGRSGR